MRRPLDGKSVLVTRPEDQSAGISEQLKALGAEVVLMPAICIKPLDRTEELDAALHQLGRYDWVVLTSVNGVKAVVDRLESIGLGLQSLRSRKLAVIGPATGDELTRLVRAPDLIPEEYVSESIVKSLGSVRGQRFLLARADIARKDLAISLRDLGAIVDEVPVYHIVAAHPGNTLPKRAPDYILLTSSAGVRATVDLLRSSDRLDWISQSRLACIGPITARTVTELGFIPHIVASQYTVPALVQSLIDDAAEVAHV